MSLLATTIMACAPSVLPSLAPAPVDLRLTTEQQHVTSETPATVVVESWTSDDWTMVPPQPVSDGLTATQTEVDGPTLVGGRQRTRTIWELSGPDGSYVVTLPETEAIGPSDQTRSLAPAPIFVDIGVEGPSAEELVGFEAPPAPAPTPWPLMAAVLVASGILFGLALLLYRRLRSTSADAAPPELPHLRARREWRDAQSAGLSDHALAMALSAIFRRFLQDVLDWPATARTTREILDFLDSTTPVTAALRQQAARVLDATDRLKFAREGGGEEFFAALSSDFEDVVAALTPTDKPDEAQP